MVNTETKVITFFTAKNGKSVHSQQKQDQQLTVAQIMNSLLPNSDLNLSQESHNFLIILSSWEKICKII